MEMNDVKLGNAHEVRVVTKMTLGCLPPFLGGGVHSLKRRVFDASTISPLEG